MEQVRQYTAFFGPTLDDHFRCYKPGTGTAACSQPPPVHTRLATETAAFSPLKGGNVVRQCELVDVSLAHRCPCPARNAGRVQCGDGRVRLRPGRGGTPSSVPVAAAAAGCRQRTQFPITGTSVLPSWAAQRHFSHTFVPCVRVQGPPQTAARRTAGPPPDHVGVPGAGAAAGGGHARHAVHRGVPHWHRGHPCLRPVRGPRGLPWPGLPQFSRYSMHGRRAGQLAC